MIRSARDERRVWLLTMRVSGTVWAPDGVAEAIVDARGRTAKFRPGDAVAVRTGGLSCEVLAADLWATKREALAALVRWRWRRHRRVR